MAQDRIKFAPTNESPEAGIAKAEKRLSARTNVRNLHPIVPIQKRNIPLNGCRKLGVIAGVSSSHATVGDLQFNLGVSCHVSKKRGHVLNRVRTNDKSPVSGFRHGLPGKVERLAHILCGLKASNRKPLETPAMAAASVPFQKLKLLTGAYPSLSQLSSGTQTAPDWPESRQPGVQCRLLESPKRKCRPHRKRRACRPRFSWRRGPNPVVKHE